MDDDNFALSSNKSKSAKKGRRAQSTAPPPDPSPADDAGETEDMATIETPAARDADAPPRPSRRVGGWGDDSKARKRGVTEEIEDERLRPQSDKEDSDSEIPVIPDLDEVQDEDMGTSIAVAPNVAVNRVATYRELDDDLLKHAAFLTLDNDIDLKLLAKNLSPEADIIEEDRPWDWDRLFTEVSSELITDWEKDENPEPAEEAA